jgi:putative phage-type endonuclease
MDAKEYLNIEQGSDAWKQIRSGKVTASMISAVLMDPKTAGYRDYQAQLVAEVLTGKPQGSDFTNAAMQFGTETEPLARSAYEAETGFSVDEVGFCQHHAIERSGASPDGLAGNSGLVEIKVPKVSTHLAYLIADVVPVAYKNQMMWQMAVTGRDWCDFVSFRPDLPEHLQLFIIRFKRDPAKILELETAVIAFLDGVDKMINQLKKV